MGKPAAVIGSMHVCPKVTSKVPHVGGPVVGGSPNVTIGGIPAARKGDKLICIGPPDTIKEGSSSVTINGKPAARMGDGTAHGGTIVIGNPTVLIGDGGGGGGGSSAPKPKAASSPSASGGGTTSSSAGKVSGSLNSPSTASSAPRIDKPVKKVDAGQSSGVRGKSGTWANELEPPAPNTVYEVTSTHAGQPVTYTYETDDQGRTVRVTGKLVKSAIEDQAERDKLHRNSATQAQYGGSDPEYDGGHLIATLFQGPAEKVNLVPQLKAQNRHGEWRQMEREWALALDEGKEVEVDIKVMYEDDTDTPVELEATYKVDSGNPITERFLN